MMGATLSGVFVSGGVSIQKAPAATSEGNLQLLFQTTAANQQINLPLKGTVNVTVDWGDGNSNIFSTTGYANKTYATSGNYIVTISGTLTGFGSSNPATSVANISRLKRVINFGNIGLTDLSGAFNGTGSGLANVPTLLPSSVSNLMYTFRNAASFNDANITSWNVSNVTNMFGMFYDAAAFNQSIVGWNTGKVSNTGFMFYRAYAFNQPIGSWNVSNVTDMQYMLANANSFNQSLNSWNTSNVTNMNYLFQGAKVFNQPLNNWNTGNVTTMFYMFSNAAAFNSDISTWNVSKVTTMLNMFDTANVFNGDISGWNVANVTTMANMFRNAYSFSSNISSWNTIKVANMEYMFDTANSFNSSIGTWNVSNVTNMTSMFRNATLFDQNLNGWCVKSVTSAPSNFNANSALANANLPYWGTCPTLNPTTTISLVGSASNSGNTVALPAHQNLDVIIAFAYRGDGTTAPTTASGWTNITTGTGNGSSFNVSRRSVSGTVADPVFANATSVITLVYRNANWANPIATTGSAIAVQGFTNGTTITYPANPYWYDDSWVLCFAGHTESDGNMSIPPSGLTTRTTVANVTTVDETGAYDSNGLYGKFDSTAVNIGGTSGNSWAITLRLLPTLA